MMKPHPEEKQQQQRRPLFHDILFGRQQHPRMHTQTSMQKRVCGDGTMVRRLKMNGRLQGHQGCVNSVAFSSEGNLCISGSDDCYVMGTYVDVCMCVYVCRFVYGWMPVSSRLSLSLVYLFTYKSTPRLLTHLTASHLSVIPTHSLGRRIRHPSPPSPQ